GWEVPAVFNWLQELGGVDVEEMRRVFNMGIGLAVVVRGDSVDTITDVLTHAGTECHTIGRIVSVE
ncbi:MAG: phosphoribosylformylglycinamidine cyclo-ligase, partial [Planctomycetaceae bacterium]|nr:phosphoribosylformylglycinamidine cyclo-ligase [Planctomycetaceae bacterium]